LIGWIAIIARVAVITACWRLRVDGRLRGLRLNRRLRGLQFAQLFE
jgi:hypothetical protein